MQEGKSHKPLPEFLTPREIAEILKVSEDTVVRRFADREGVIDLGSPESRHRRRYRTLRIPRYVLDLYLHEIGVGRGRMVLPSERRKSR